MKKIEKNSLTVGVSFVTVSTVLCSIIHFIFSVYARKFVSVYDYGLFTSCGLLATYMNYLQIGVINSLNRDYPQLKGAGKIKEAKNIRNIVISLLCIIYGIAILVIECILIVLLKQGIVSTQTFWGLLIMAPTAFFTVLESLVLINARMDGHLKYSALITLVKTVVSVCVGIVSIKLYGYYGLFITTPLAAIVSIVLLSKQSMNGFRFHIDYSIIKCMILTGFPLLINGFAWTVVTSIDKFVILKFMDVEALGFYSIALLGFSTIVVVPNTIAQLLYIKMGESYGREKSISELIKKTNYYTEWLALCSGATVLISYYLLPIFVRIVMPQYFEGISAAQIMIIGVAIYASSILYGNIFSILKLNATLIGTTVSLCFFNVTISSILVLLNKCIDMVALGTALSYVLYALLLVIRLHKQTQLRVIDAIRSSWTPIAFSIMPCIICSVLSLNDWISLGVGILVYACYAAVFLKKRSFLG